MTLVVKKRLSDYRSARPDDPQLPLRVFMGLLNEGVLLSQRGLGACSLAMTDADVDRFVDALGPVLDRERATGLSPLPRLTRESVSG
jgi:glutamate-1-semialdehyde aminotransferase